jgi:hypothetical protein
LLSFWSIFIFSLYIFLSSLLLTFPELLFRYLLVLSKTIKLDIKHCNQESLHRPIDCYSTDVICTYKTLKSHWPTFIAEDLSELPNHAQPMFLEPKPKFMPTDQVWFLKSPVGKNPLGKTLKTLVEGTVGIVTEGRTFTNKTARHIGITRMEEGMVPAEKGMRITGHRDIKSYEKYNACLADSEQRACQNLILRDSVLAKGKPVNYQDFVVDQNMRYKAQHVVILFYLLSTMFWIFGFSL